VKITVVSFIDKTSCVILQLEHSVQHWLSCMCFSGSEHIWGTHVEIPSSSYVRALGKARPAPFHFGELVPKAMKCTATIHKYGKYLKEGGGGGGESGMKGFWFQNTNPKREKGKNIKNRKFFIFPKRGRD